eukprot:Colp12_sorted_trinity150504_noHs@30816
MAEIQKVNVPRLILARNEGDGSADELRERTASLSSNRSRTSSIRPVPTATKEEDDRIRHEKAPPKIPRHTRPWFQELKDFLIVVVAFALWPLATILTSFAKGIKFFYVTGTVLRILWDLIAFFVVRIARYILEYSSKRHHFWGDIDYQSWYARALKHDEKDDKLRWREEVPSPYYDYPVLQETLKSLRQARLQRDCKTLLRLMKDCMHRQYCGLDNTRLHTTCRSGTKYIIEEYMQEVTDVMAFLGNHQCFDHPIDKKLEFFEQSLRQLGTTALCLSGGGSLAMYHMGVVRALVETGCMPKVISGASGGALVAGMLAIKTDEEMADIYVTDISNRYGKKFFRPVWEQIKHFYQNGVLMNWEEFADTCRAYYGAFTFLEAYQRTGRIVNIAVTKSHDRPHPIVLNYVNSPDILIWSAITATCAIPGLMGPVVLYAKDKNGHMIQANVDGVTWMDGSITADVPREMLKRQFNVNQFIISQVNPHVAPFVREVHSGHQETMLQRVENLLNRDIKHRTTRLAKLGLLPRFFGQDLKGVLLQDYSSTTRAEVTILPHVSLYDNLKVISHPSNEDMERYISQGLTCVWSKIPIIKHRLKFETALNEAIEEIKEELLSKESAKKLAEKGSRSRSF